MQILALNISNERNMFVAERFMSDLVKGYGKHNISTDGEALGTPWRVDFLDLNTISILRLREA
jgi:hypothetical protein